MNMYKPPLPMGAGAPMRQEYKNISQVPPTSGVAALMHHSQGSQFQGHEDDRQKRIFFRDKERERRRLGLSAPDNYGGVKDQLKSMANAGRPGQESFSLSRNQESPINFLIPKIEKSPIMQQPAPQYFQPQIQQQAQPQYFDPLQQFQQQQFQQQQYPSQYYPQTPQQFQQHPFMPNYGMPQTAYSPPPPMGPPGYLPFQQAVPPFNPYLQPQMPQLMQQVQPAALSTSPQGRAGGQPRQGGRSPQQQAPIYFPDPQNPNAPQRETFFDKFGQPDNVQQNLNSGGLSQQDKQRKLREELEQQIQEKKKRQEEERIDKEKWEMKYGEGNFMAQQAKQQPPVAAANVMPNASPFPGQQQYPGLQNQPTFQPGPTTPQNLNNSFGGGNGTQNRQLPGGGTQVAHGAVPHESNNSPNRNHPSQQDSYKNELMVQIEEKRKLKELERKKKMEEDEREEMRVKKEMEEMQKRYQYEVNPDAPPIQQQQQNVFQGQPNDQDINRSVDNGQYNNNGGEQIQKQQQYGPNNNSYDENMGEYQNENFDSYQDQPLNSGNYRGSSQNNISYQQNQQRFAKQQSRKIQAHNQKIDWNQDPTIGPDSTPQAFESQFVVPEKDNQSQSQNNSQQINYNPVGNRSKLDSFDNNQRLNPQQHRQQYIQHPNIQMAPQQQQNQFQQNNQQQYQNSPDFINHGNNDFQSAPYFNSIGGGPPLNVPMPPPPPNLLADFDPFKQKLQEQLSTFQKDILRMQHQQKSMMKNYHKEIEQLQYKKQQIISDMKSDQDIQMKMQIQQLSTAIAQLSYKMSNNSNPQVQRYNSLSPPPPNKSEIVAEVIQELKNVLPMAMQPLQYQHAQHSQSHSPPPHSFNPYQQQHQYSPPPTFQNQAAFVHQPPAPQSFHSELPQQLQSKLGSNVQTNVKSSPYSNKKQQHPQQHPYLQQPDVQLPSTTVMMPHNQVSPPQKALNQQYQGIPVYQEAEEEIENVPVNEIPNSTQLIPHEGSFKEITPVKPQQLNNTKVDINITLPLEVTSHKQSLIEKSKQIHDHKIAILEQVKEQQVAEVDALETQRIRLNVVKEVNIQMPHEVQRHRDSLIQKAKEIHFNPSLPVIEEAANSLSQLNKNIPQRRLSSAMQMPMMDVLKEVIEYEESEQSNQQENHTLETPKDINSIKRKSFAAPEVNIQLPHEQSSHKTSLLEKAKQIHDHTLPDRSSLASSSLDKRRKLNKQEENLVRQSSQLSSQPILETLEEEQDSALQSERSIKLKKKPSLQLKLLNQKSIAELNNQVETPREEREKIMERIRQKNEKLLKEESVKDDSIPQVALNIDKSQRQSLNNSENGNQKDEAKGPVIQAPPVVFRSRDIGTSIPGQRRGKNGQQFPKSQIPRIPKPTSSTVVHSQPFAEQEELNSDLQLRQKQQQDPINIQPHATSQETLDSARRFTDAKSNNTAKSSQQIVKATKLNNQAYNEALDSIKQVHANLEARNIIGSNPIQRVNQRGGTKLITPDENLELGPARLITENFAPIIPISQNDLSQNNYTQEEFYEQLPPNEGSIDQQHYNNADLMYQYVEAEPSQFQQKTLLDDAVIIQQNPNYLMDQVQMAEFPSPESYYQVPINRSLGIQQQSMNMLPIYNQQSQSQTQLIQQLQAQQRESFGKSINPNIEIPNPPLVFQDEFGNFVNFVPDSFTMNGENFYQNPLVTQSFQMIQRNPYQAQLPLNQQRPLIKPEYDYNEEFQHLAREDSRMPTPISSQPTGQQVPENKINITPQKEQKEVFQSPPKQVSPQLKQLTPPPKSDISKPIIQEVQYQMIVPADTAQQIKNPVFEMEESSEEKIQYKSPTQQMLPKKETQPMTVPPWRSHLNLSQAPPQNHQDQEQLQYSHYQKPQQQPPQIQGYNTEDTVQYRIEQQQNVLEQELLYDQLMQYERQHLEEVQEYMKQQQATRDQLIEPYNENVGRNQEGVPQQLSFPDFTGFLYNKFLVNGPQVGFVPFEKEPQLKLDTPTRKVISPRTKFMMQVQNTPSYTLVSRDPSHLLPEPPRPPTQLILNNIVNKSIDQTNQNASSMLLPYTSSHMMRPVTQAPPRRQDDEPNQQDEQKEFLMKIDQIQQIVGEYEMMKKDIELERMIQEQYKNEEMSKDYLRSLQKVEMLVNDKGYLKMMRKSYDQESFNIGDQSSEDILSPSNKQHMMPPPKVQRQIQYPSHSNQSQGHRPNPQQQLIHEVPPVEEDTMHEMSQSMPPSQMKQLEVLNSPGDRQEQSQFSRQLSEQLNIADGSLLSESMRPMQQNQNQQKQNAQQIELPDINSSKPQTGVKFLRDMLKQVPSIPMTGGGQSNQNSRNKPPLPPINSKAASQTLPPTTRTDLNVSSYIPRHILNNPGIMLPPIRQSSSQQSSSNREFDGTSLINLGNDDSNHQINQNSNILQLKPLKRNSSSLSNLFEPLPQPKLEYNKGDPFALRDRLKQTLQETGQILRNDNISLLQKVQEAGKSIKPSYYEQGLPPIIDLAQRDIVHLSQPMDYAPRPAHLIQMPEVTSSTQQDYVSSYHPQAGSFSNNFQQWDMKRAVARNTDERYNIVRSSANSLSQPNQYSNNDLVREMMQLRQIEQQQMMASAVPMKRQNSLPKISQAASPKIITSSLKPLPTNGERTSIQSLGQLYIITLQSNQQPTNNNSSEQVKYDDSVPTLNKVEQTQHSLMGSLIETKALPTNFVQSPIHEQHSEQSHNGFSSNYDDVSRLGDSDEKIVYKVVEHIVESPKNLFGASLKPEVMTTKVSQDAYNQQYQPSIQEQKSSQEDFADYTAFPSEGASFSGAAVKAINEAGDQTQQNVKNDRNIQLEEETANVWVSRWFNQAQAPSTSETNLAEQKISPSNNQLSPSKI